MFIQTQIDIPQVRKSLVSRPSLIGKLSEGLGSKLTLVSAQAGYGKTTALATWAKQCGAPVAWVSLDKLDSDWSPFWDCVLSSIRGRVPGFGVKLGFLLDMESPASFEPGISALLNELNQLEHLLVLVLDDYHVIDVPANISKLWGDGDWNKALRRAEQAEQRFEALKDVIPEQEWKQLMGNLYYFCGIICYLQRNLTRASHNFELLDHDLPEGSSFQNFGSNRYQDYDHFTDLLSLNHDLQHERFVQDDLYFDGDASRQVRAERACAVKRQHEPCI
ncbi:hypothetical protein ACFFK0_07225 [Paenibacillus chartarius]|uniref:Transcriptional regulator n=1 Tax=Paenibacillus chartarius TaxID=747481 RepID=A0ABV6DHX6_9BACL